MSSLNGASHDSPSIEHFWPRSKNKKLYSGRAGTIVVCARCNGGKRDSDFDDWVERNRGCDRYPYIKGIQEGLKDGSLRIQTLGEIDRAIELGGDPRGIAGLAVHELHRCVKGRVELTRRQRMNKSYIESKYGKQNDFAPYI